MYNAIQTLLTLRSGIRTISWNFVSSPSLPGCVNIKLWYMLTLPMVLDFFSYSWVGGHDPLLPVSNSDLGKYRGQGPCLPFPISTSLTLVLSSAQAWKWKISHYGLHCLFNTAKITPPHRSSQTNESMGEQRKHVSSLLFTANEFTMKMWEAKLIISLTLVISCPYPL